jgi:hypothetical protein
MIATAEFVVPKSMPITGPLTFLSSSSAYLTNEELKGLRKRFAWRVAEEVARGRALVNLEDNILAVATRSGDRRRVYD